MFSLAAVGVPSAIPGLMPGVLVILINGVTTVGSELLVWVHGDAHTIRSVRVPHRAEEKMSRVISRGLIASARRVVLSRAIRAQTLTAPE